MAKYEGGILAPVHGKVGSVVGSNWRAIDYVRSYTSHVKNPRTTAQQAQRGRLAKATGIARQLLPGARPGLTARCQVRSEFNELVRQLMGLESNVEQLDRLVFSSGPRAGVLLGAFTKPQAAGKVEVSFTSQPSAAMDRSDDDAVYVVYYDAKANRAAVAMAPRSDGKVELTVHDKAEGLVYLFAYVRSSHGVGSATTAVKVQ